MSQGHKQSSPCPARAEGQKDGVRGLCCAPPEPSTVKSSCSPRMVESINILFFSRHPHGNRLSTLPKASKTSTRRSACWPRRPSRPLPRGRWGSCGCRCGGPAASLGPEASRHFTHCGGRTSRAQGALGEGPGTRWYLTQPSSVLSPEDVN